MVPDQPLTFSMLVFALYTLSSLFARGGGAAAPFMTSLKLGGIALCPGLMMKGIWPRKLRRFFPIYWFFALSYVLGFSGTLAFLRVHETPIDAVQWIVGLTLLFCLADSTHLGRLE